MRLADETVTVANEIEVLAPWRILHLSGDLCELIARLLFYLLDLFTHTHLLKRMHGTKTEQAPEVFGGLLLVSSIERY
ncbi:MAG: hypothetical protein A3F53_02435 [Candidatus Zambryskibacteria bacterium RIFCSPHIGHO2_12_FULL_48_10]|uniref:Uncharacterized protein n=1 Tax=Candidatus Zambryskibacteria bacterium RIFCSPHIGHO2_01_FULL_46_25 TaxID=1802738 RepID=A0A1G2SZZ5_9BACT|nr:MAG: hypothetical protein A2838_01185 [Candidatus Zambryskibacteria bacterium RIFCSPHIGHO2_01_FULL_46_25]OHB02732.1 MAG: hypothetical protein A3F53_02435 [Candidatus Zambryskibacteria bacterium RIFCSPHIGHO2_12_FULL_48_10]